MARKRTLVHGFGINDANYNVMSRINGCQVMYPFYRRWANVLERCFSKKLKDKYPSYIGCSIHHEWLTFSKFKAWMEKQDWRGKELDKDLLIPRNKTYSPEACVFVDVMTNLFTTDSAASRGEWPIGVSFCKRSKKFLSQCCNPFSKKREFLGYFTCPEQAHEAWRRRKHELACQLASLQADNRVGDALRARYA